MNDRLGPPHEVVEPPSTAPRYGRRFILGAMAAAPIPLVMACGGSDPKPNTEVENVAFVAKLQEITELGSQPTVEDIAQHEHQYHQTNWMKNTSVGTFYNDRGQAVSFGLDLYGEPTYDLKRQESLTGYPLTPFEAARAKAPKGTLIVYGNMATLQRLNPQLDTMVAFLQDYFSYSKAPENFLHLNFMPASVRFPISWGPSQIDVPPAGGAQQLLSVNDKSKQAKIFKRVDVIVNVHRVHRDAEILGISQIARLTEVFANEATNMNGSVYSTELEPKATGPDNESMSSLVGRLASMHKPTAQAILGGTAYQSFFAMITKESAELAVRLRK